MCTVIVYISLNIFLIVKIISIFYIFIFLNMYFPYLFCCVIFLIIFISIILNMFISIFILPRIIKICGNFEFCNIQRDSREDYKNKINVYKINVIKSYKRYIPAIILLIAIILYENDIKNAAISLPNIIDK